MPPHVAIKSVRVLYLMPNQKEKPHPFGWGFLFGYGSKLRSCHPGYVTDERSSLGRSPCPLPVADAGQGL